MTRTKWDYTARVGEQAVAWREVTASPGSAFRTKGSRWRFQEIEVFDVLQTAYRSQHRPDRMFSERAFVSVFFMHVGSFTIHHNGRHLIVPAGDAGFVRDGSTALIDSPGTSRITCVRIPVDVLQAAGVVFPLWSGRFAEKSVLLVPVQLYLRTLLATLSAEVVGDVDEAVVAATITNLVSSLFFELAEGYGLEVRGFPGLRARAECLIREQSRDRLLTPASVASQMNISVRQLQRAFRQDNRTVSQEIRAQRLRNARAALLAPHASRPPLTTIVYAAGFSSVKEYRHALRISPPEPPSASSDPR